VTTGAPDYDAVYFDSNELLANGWPDPSVKLSNFLYIAGTWNIRRFIPAPVLDETEAHWLRGVENQIARLVSSQRELERVARPVNCSVQTQHSNTAEMQALYRAIRDRSITHLQIEIVPYTQGTAESFFQRATKYIAPFAKDAEGKGFQDAVILQSVIEHLHADGDLRGILITKDAAIMKTDLGQNFPDFDASRLRFIPFDEAWEPLVRFHVDQTVIQPWHEEQKNALAAVRANEQPLKMFLATHLAETMLRAGEFGTPATAVKVLSVDSLDVTSVDTPIQGSNERPDRKVTISITASARCTAILRKTNFGFYGALLSAGFPNAVESTSPASEEVTQGPATWTGGIRATAEVANRQFQNIVPESLMSDEELRSNKT
jgi:hypothetical protein